MKSSYNRRKLAEINLDRIWEDPLRVNIIHYACERFGDGSNAKSSRISSIAVRNLKNSQIKSFSIHQYAELSKISINDQINNNFEMVEEKLLSEFFNFVKDTKEFIWLHWNMQDAIYGFHALEHRFRMLGGDPVIIEDSKKFNLSRCLRDIYGENYINSPRLDSIRKKNNINPLNFFTGKAEAEFFEKNEFLILHSATLAKVRVLSHLCELASERKLKTNTNWWEYNCSSMNAVVDWMFNNPFVRVAIIISAILSWIF